MGKKTHGPVFVAAIEHNDFDKVKEILVKNFKNKSQIQDLCVSEVRRLASEYTEIPIILAASLPDPTIIVYLVSKQDVNLNFVHKEVVKRKTKIKTALLTAVRSSLILTVEAILALNANPNIQDHKGRTAVHHSVRKADYRTTKMLLTRGANPNITDAAGNTPLHIATIFGHLELVKLLLHHGADLFKKGTGGAIPIHMAAKEGHTNLIKLFYQHDVNINMKVPCYDSREKAPIHVAAEEGHAETVLVLLDPCGADPNIRDSVGETPLHCACLREYDPMGMKSKDDFTETTKVLLQYGAHIDLQNSRGETPLHLAARNEFQKTVEVLVQAGSDPTLEENGGYKPYDLATADDTVTIQILKSAMEERDQVMNDAMELQAKGYSTSLTSQALASRSGLHINAMGSRENLLSQSRSNGNMIYEDGYLQPVGLRQGGLSGSQNLLGKSQSTGTSSSGSKPSQWARQKQNMSSSSSGRHNMSRSDEVAEENKHVNTSQNKGRSLPEPPPQRESKMTEVSSFWTVTPRTSVSTFKDDNTVIEQAAAKLHKSYESLPDHDPPAAPKGPKKRTAGKKPAKKVAKPKNSIQIMPAHPNANKIPQSQYKEENTDDDSFFDDESFDTLDTLSEDETEGVPVPQLRLQPKPNQHSPEEQQKINMAASNHSLNKWLDEQADILKVDGSMPHPPNVQPSSDIYNTNSDISSVSKVKKVPRRTPNQKQAGPPPLPPKPAPRKPSGSQQVTQQEIEPPKAPQGKTVIKVVPNLDTTDDASQDTEIETKTTEVYEKDPYHSSKMSWTNDGSESARTETTISNYPINVLMKDELSNIDRDLKTRKMDLKNVIPEEPAGNNNSVKARNHMRTKSTDTVEERKRNDQTFFIRTGFKYDAGDKSELSFKHGEILHVKDTKPNTKQGMWFAAKVNPKPNESKQGYIPNESSAQHTATSLKIAELRAQEIASKGGVFRKNFRRTKSLDRVNKKDLESPDFKQALKQVVAYERVVSKKAQFKRPVVLLGLFCDSVRELLIQDLPAYFDKPANAVEILSRNSSEGPGNPDVDTEPIESVMNEDKHCIVVLSPVSVRYLQDKTKLNPMVVYLCPQNKANVKELKARFAPGFDRKPGFMYDEAIHFAKQHDSMFTTVVNYTSDNSWMSNLKDTIAHVQNEPTWHNAASLDESSSEESSDEWNSDSQNASEFSTARNQPKVSKTTDDIPNEIQSVLSRHVGSPVAGPPMKSQSIGDALNDRSFEFETDPYNIHVRQPASAHNNHYRQPFPQPKGNQATKSILKNQSHLAKSEGKMSPYEDDVSTSSWSSVGQVNIPPKQRGRSVSTSRTANAMFIQRPAAYEGHNTQYQQRQPPKAFKRETPL